MQDIELIAQAGVLISDSAQRDTLGGIDCAVDAGWLTEDQALQLQAGYRFFAMVQMSARLIREGEISLDDLGQGGCGFLGRMTEMPDLDHLQAKMQRQAQICAEIIGEILPDVRDAE